MRNITFALLAACLLGGAVGAASHFAFAWWIAAQGLVFAGEWLRARRAGDRTVALAMLADIRIMSSTKQVAAM